MPVAEVATISVQEFEGVSAPLPVDERLASTCGHLLDTRGKQLRAAIVFECARQGPRPDAPEVREAALAIELVHLATLAHDDVVDDGTIRRGLETAGARYGSSASSFAGLWLLGRAVELVSGGGDEAVALMSKAITRLCGGQMREVQDLYNVDRGAERYFEAIQGKTAALFALSARLGAELGGAPAHVALQLERFGWELGIAYQLSDDVLDISGDEAALGKPPGSDLRQGVFTLPVIFAMEAHEDLRERLASHYDKSEVPEIVAEIEATDAIDRAREQCGRHARLARSALGGLSCTERLFDVLRYAAGRVEVEVEG